MPLKDLIFSHNYFKIHVRIFMMKELYLTMVQSWEEQNWLNGTLESFVKIEAQNAHY